MGPSIACERFSPWYAKQTAAQYRTEFQNASQKNGGRAHNCALFIYVRATFRSQSSTPNTRGSYMRRSALRLIGWYAGTCPAEVFSGERRTVYCERDVVGGTLALAWMASPLTTSSTRRFFWRPSGVSLEATGCVLPNPFDVTEPAEAHLAIK